MGWVWLFNWIARNNFPHHSFQSVGKNIGGLASNRPSQSLKTYRQTDIY